MSLSDIKTILHNVFSETDKRIDDIISKAEMNDVDISVAKTMTEEELQKILCLTFGQARKLATYLKKLKVCKQNKHTNGNKKGLESCEIVEEDSSQNSEEVDVEESEVLEEESDVIEDDSEDDSEVLEEESGDDSEVMEEESGDDSEEWKDGESSSEIEEYPGETTQERRTSKRKISAMSFGVKKSLQAHIEGLRGANWNKDVVTAEATNRVGQYKCLLCSNLKYI